MMSRRADVLVGWKEIAAYLGSSVATAARRERDGLPVFRSGGQVRAFPGDIDKWLKGLRADELNPAVTAEGVEKVEVKEDISAVLATLLKGDSQERLAVVRIGKDVAEFEHIEVQLKSAEEKYRELVEAVPEWVWEMNAEGEYVYSSPQVVDILGYGPEDVQGFRADEFLVHPDDAGKFQAAIEALTLRKEVAHDVLCRYIHREGSIRYIETSANPVFDVSGNVSGIRGVSRDVTERVRLQMEVTETRTYLENVLRGSMDAIITTDMDGRVKVWNRGAEAIYGYPESEALKKNVDRLTDPPGWSRKFQDLFRIVEAKGGWYAEEPVERRRKNGTTFYASASYSVVYGTDGKPAGICGITRDITDRLNAERFTREALSRFESVLENVPNVAVQGFGRDGTVHHWNRAAERIFGYAADEAVGAEVNGLSFLPGKERGGFAKELERVFVTGEPNDPSEVSFVNLEGERRWVYSQMFPVLVDDKVEEVFQMSIDVTERNKFEEALINAAEEWRRTFDTVPDSIAIIGNEYRVLRLNKAMADRIGVHPRDAIGLTCYEAFHGLDGPHESCPHALLLKDGREHTAEIFDERLDEYFEISVSPIKDASGELIGSVHVARDITERKRTEEALTASRDFQDRILNGMYEAVSVIGRDYKIQEVNACFVEKYNMSREEAIGRTCHEITHRNPERCRNPEHLCPLEVVFDKREPYSVEHIHKDRDGDDLIVEIYAFPLFGPDGEVECMVEIANDITEHKRAEEALAKSERVYRGLYDTTLALADEKDLDEVIEVIADRAKELFDARDCVVYLTDLDENVLVPIYSNDLNNFKEIMAYEMPVGVGLSGRVVETGEGAYINAGTENDYSAHVPGTDEAEDADESVMAVPMIVNGRDVSGVITIGRVNDVFDDDDLEKLTVFARQAEIAIKRARDDRAVRESEEKYRGLIETINEGVGTVDTAESLTFVNRAFAESLGYTVEELTGMNLREITTSKGYKKIRRETEKRRGGESSRYVLELQHKDGPRLDFLVSAAPVYGEDGTYNGSAATVSRLPELER
jgi:PAS domain S-box-containing protein